MKRALVFGPKRWSAANSTCRFAWAAKVARRSAPGAKATLPTKNRGIQFCTSQILWDELREKQHSDAEGYTNIDQVFSSRNELRDANEKALSLFDTTCAREGARYTALTSEEDTQRCTSTLDKNGANCTMAQNPFPGVFMGSTSGSHCVSKSQYEVLRWTFGVMKNMGWEIEGSGMDGGIM
jgi:hypothetical protein